MLLSITRITSETALQVGALRIAAERVFTNGTRDMFSMTHRIVTQRKATLPIDGTEKLLLSSLLARYLWPFWLFRDVSCGGAMARAAAYRHNRDMRVHLPCYLLKWLVITTACLAVTTGLASLSDGKADVFLILAASTGMLFASSVCMFVLIAYLYLYLCLNAY